MILVLSHPIIKREEYSVQEERLKFEAAYVPNRFRVKLPRRKNDADGEFPF